MIEDNASIEAAAPAVETAEVKRTGPIKATAGELKISGRPTRVGEQLVRVSGARPRRIDTASGVQVSRPRKPLAPELMTVPSSRPAARVDATASSAARTSGSDLKSRSPNAARVIAASSAVKVTGTTLRSRAHLRGKVMMGGGS